MGTTDNEVIVSKKDILNLAGEKIEEKLANELDEDDQYDEEYGVEMDDEYEQELMKAQGFDVFDDIINPRVDKGDYVKWKIKQDGEVVASKSGKGSWEQIHKEFGRGTFSIVPRSSTTHRFLKPQTLTLADYRGDENDIVEAKENSFDMNSFMEFQREDRQYMNEEIARREKAAEERAEKQFNLVTSMMGEKKSDNSFEFMKFMVEQQNRQDQIRREEEQRREDQRREDQRRADERFEKLLASMATPKEDANSISAIEHFEKIREAERQAKEEAKAEYEEIERKAREKAEEIAETKGDKSITEKAIEGIMETAPILAKVFAKNAGVAAPNPQRAIAAPRRAKKPMKVVGLSGTENQTVENPQKTSKINDSETDKREKAKAAITQICAPIILGSIMEEEVASDCATKCIARIEELGVDRKAIAMLFNSNDFVELAKSEGLHDIAKASGRAEELESWLKELYEFLVKPISKENDKAVEVVGLNNNQPTI